MSENEIVEGIKKDKQIRAVKKDTKADADSIFDLLETNDLFKGDDYENS